jgi:hypothetical protein
LAVSSSETSLKIHQTTWCNIPEDGCNHIHHCKNLKSLLVLTILIFSLRVKNYGTPCFEFSTAFCHFIPLRYKYSTQLPCFQMWQTKFHTNTKQHVKY